MRQFEYMAPESLAEACSLLSRHGEEAKIIAGGQSLIPLLQQRLIAPTVLVDIKGFDQLAYISNGNGHVRVGALTIHRAVETSPLIRERLPVLSEAERRLGYMQIRNWGTVGGNLSHADPAGDLAPALIALGAKVKAVSVRGEREIPLDEFFIDLFTSALAHDEILAEVQIPFLSTRAGAAYRKESVIAGGSPIASVAAAISLDDGRDIVREARIVLGGVGPTPLRARQAEQALAGNRVESKLIEEVAEIAAGEAQPVPTVDGSVEYKRTIVKVVTEEMIGLAAKRARVADWSSKKGV